MRKFMVLAVLGIAVAAVLVFWATPKGSQANGSSPDWDVTGTWTGCSGLVGNCAYSFSMDLNQNATGAVTGTIVYPNTPPNPPWPAPIQGDITGQVSGSGFSFTRTDPSGYWATCVNCAIAPNGLSFSGTGVGPGQEVMWQADGVARHLPTMSIDDCSPGVYPGWGDIWTGFVSSFGSDAITPVVTSPDLAAGRTYRIEASGTFYAGGTNLFDIEADAEYSQDTYQRVNNLAWTDSVHNYESYGEGLLELKVDGGFVEWGTTFSSDHRYTLDTAGTGDPVTFDLQIYDIHAQNNTGGICVAIYEPYSLLWLPPISLDDWTLNEKATLPIKFQLDDPNTGEIICADLNPTLKVNGTPLLDLRYSTDGCSYIANFRPSSQGNHQAVVTLGSVQLGSLDFDVREAGTPNGRGKRNN